MQMTQPKQKQKIRGCGLAEAPPVFQAGWSYLLSALFSFFVRFICLSETAE
jgi:hypothetical protein